VSDKPLGKNVLQNIQNFTKQNKLRKAVGKAVAKNMSQKEKDDLAAIFREFDTNGDGKLDPSEIAAMMKKIGVSEQEAKMMAKELDEDGDGGVDLDEYAAVAMVGAKAGARATFEMFDKDGDGFVTAREILAVCDFMTSDQVNEIMGQADGNNDGKLGFEEWVAAMGKMNN